MVLTAFALKVTGFGLECLIYARFARKRLRAIIGVRKRPPLGPYSRASLGPYGGPRVVILGDGAFWWSRAPTRWSAKVSCPQNSGGYVTKFAQYNVLKLTA